MAALTGVGLTVLFWIYEINDGKRQVGALP